jgi:hypothetical protein
MPSVRSCFIAVVLGLAATSFVVQGSPTKAATSATSDDIESLDELDAMELDLGGWESGLDYADMDEMLGMDTTTWGRYTCVAAKGVASGTNVTFPARGTFWSEDTASAKEICGFFGRGIKAMAKVEPAPADMWICVAEIEEEMMPPFLSSEAMAKTVCATVEQEPYQMKLPAKEASPAKGGAVTPSQAKSTPSTVA